MKEKLQKFIDNQELIAVFTDEDDTYRFSVGYILAANDIEFLIEEISPLGKYDGLSCRLINDIIKLEYDNEYIDNISKLFEYHKEKRNNSIIIKDSPLISLFDFAKVNKKICYIQLCDSKQDDAVGFVESIEEDFVNIKIIQNNGRCDGNSIVQLKQITFVTCDREEDRKYEWLFNLNN